MINKKLITNAVHVQTDFCRYSVIRFIFSVCFFKLLFSLLVFLIVIFFFWSIRSTELSVLFFLQLLAVFHLVGVVFVFCLFLIFDVVFVHQTNLKCPKFIGHRKSKRIVCSNSFVYFRRNKNGPLEYFSKVFFLFDFQSFQIYIFLVFYVVSSVCRWTNVLFNIFFIFRCCLFCTCKI